MNENVNKRLRLDQTMGRVLWFVDKVCSSDEYASEVYSALCNNEFYELDAVANRFTCSWRYSASLVARIAGKGVYTDWYCSGNEGSVSDRVLADFIQLGWNVMPIVQYEDFLFEQAQSDDHAWGIDLRQTVAVPGDFRIALAGGAGSGKDTAASIIKELYPNSFTIAFADDVKLMCAQMVNDFGRVSSLTGIYVSTANIEASNTHRELLRPLWQWVGTDLVRSRYPYYWINRVACRLNSNAFARRVIITDCRFDNEAEWALRNGFVIARLVGRGRPVPDHESERRIASLPVSIEYNNDGSIGDLRGWLADTLIPMAEKVRSS